jgi:hypothetical protein
VAMTTVQGSCPSVSLSALNSPSRTAQNHPRLYNREAILPPDRQDGGHIFEVDQHALRLAHGPTH